MKEETFTFFYSTVCHGLLPAADQNDSKDKWEQFTSENNCSEESKDAFLKAVCNACCASKGNLFEAKAIAEDGEIKLISCEPLMRIIPKVNMTFTEIKKGFAEFKEKMSTVEGFNSPEGMALMFPKYLQEIGLNFFDFTNDGINLFNFAHPRVYARCFAACANDSPVIKIHSDGHEFLQSEWKELDDFILYEELKRIAGTLTNLRELRLKRKAKRALQSQKNAHRKKRRVHNY